jgi:Response regulator containing a CheY-like receiver domain and an HTH DNA-binding domain
VRHPVTRTDVTTRPKLDEVDEKILKLIAAGATNQGIARALGVSTATTGRRLTTLFEKLGAKDRTHATVIGLAAKIFTVTDVQLPTWVQVEMYAVREAIPHGG